MIYTYIVNIYHTTLHPMQRCLICNSKFQGFTSMECALLYMCIGVSTYPQKHQPSPFCQAPHKSENFQSPPPPSSSPLAYLSLYILVFCKAFQNQIFQWLPILIKFFILNFISSFKSLKLSKFLVIISQFKFLFVTEKHFCLWTFFVIKHLRF